MIGYIYCSTWVNVDIPELHKKSKGLPLVDPFKCIESRWPKTILCFDPDFCGMASEEGALVVHQDGSLSSIDADEFWTRIFGQKPEEMNVVTTSDRARKSNAKAFDFKRALAGASRDDDRKKKCHGQGDNHGSRVSSDDAIAQADGEF